MGRTSDARDRLIDSARQLMHERGYTAVGVQEICEAAGVNKGSFYHFFPSKQAIALAVLDAFWEEVERALESSLGPRPGDEPLDPLHRHFQFLVAQGGGEGEAGQAQQSCQGCPRGCLLGNLALEMSTQDPVIRERVAHYLDLQVERFAAVLESAAAAGMMPSKDVQQAARGLLAYIEGVTLMAKAHSRPVTMADLSPGAFRLLGIAA